MLKGMKRINMVSKSFVFKSVFIYRIFFINTVKFYGYLIVQKMYYAGSPLSSGYDIWFGAKKSEKTQSGTLFNNI